MAQIAQFLMHLAENKDALDEFQSSGKAASAAMTAFGLSPEQQALLQTNDGAKIEAAVRAELGSGADISRVHGLISDMFCPPPG